MVSLEQFGLKTANIGYLLTRTFRNTSQYYGYLSNLTDYFLHSVFYSYRESGGALSRDSFLVLPTALLAHWPPCGRVEEEINVGGKSGNTRRKAVVGREEERDKYCTRGRVGTLGGRLQYEYSTYIVVGRAEEEINVGEKSGNTRGKTTVRVYCSREGRRRDQYRREE